MRPVAGFVALCSGVVTSVIMFVGGMGVATYLIAVEERQGPGPSVDVADLWTSYPRKIDTARQERMLERLPPVAQIPDAQASRDGDAAEIDETTTASVSKDDDEERNRLALLAAAHFAWCRSRYRSYDEAKDSYTSYSGARRPCVSPLSKGLMLARENNSRLGPTVSRAGASAGADDPDVPVVHYASDAAEAGYLTEDHISDCFSRYRSYRPEDNSYQPYGGGPRRQCD